MIQFKISLSIYIYTVIYRDIGNNIDRQAFPTGNLHCHLTHSRAGWHRLQPRAGLKGSWTSASSKFCSHGWWCLMMNWLRENILSEKKIFHMENFVSLRIFGFYLVISFHAKNEQKASGTVTMEFFQERYFFYLALPGYVCKKELTCQTRWIFSLFFSFLLFLYWGSPQLME